MCEEGACSVSRIFGRGTEVQDVKGGFRGFLALKIRGMVLTWERNVSCTKRK